MTRPNWALPAAICASAIALSVFQRWMVVIAVITLGLTALAFVRERARWRSMTTRYEGDARELHSVRQRSHRMRAVLDAAGVPIIATNNKGVITLASRSAEVLVGGGRTLLERSFEELFTQHELHEMEQLARQGEPGRARLELPIEGERRTLIVSADCVGDGLGCVLTLRDVTELVRAGELKADFAANASHELRTPIASIRGAADTLQGPGVHDEKMLDRLTTMISFNAGRLEALVNDLLDLSKLESAEAPPELSQVNLERLCATQIEEFAGVCERRELTIKAHIDPGVETITSDESLIGLMLRNLIENATKFAREHTEITVRCIPASIPADPGSPPPPDANLEMGFRLEVQDRGIGIPLAQQQRIFERFYQVDRARTGGGVQRGTGLGLAIVKHAARRLGGRVGVESVYQNGTTMIVELPRCADSPNTHAF